MAGTLTRAPASRALPADIQTLRPDDIASLRLPGKRGDRALRETLLRHPGRSVWSPSSLEYAIICPWRNRSDIACVDELVAVRHAAGLLESASERCFAHGDVLLLAIDLDAKRDATRYERAGMELLEEVITYELTSPRESWRPHRSIRLIPITAGDDRAIETITRLDQAAFPWLWQNNRTEFEGYLSTPGVDVAMLVAHDEPVAYIGTTMFAGWGHLDRIAVSPEFQGRGIGHEALGLAVETMRSRGARSVALSTQRTNRRSQRLYERFGFRRAHDHDYRLFGRWRLGQRHPPEHAI